MADGTTQTPMSTDGVIRSTDGTIQPPAPTPTPSDQTGSSSNLDKTSQTSQTPEPGKKTETTQSSDGKSLLNKDGKTETPVATGAPETYADFKAPEGFEIDKEAISKALPIFKELNLSQEGAQKLVDFYAAQNQQAAEAPFKLWADTQKQWTDEAHTRFGKDIEEGGKILTTFSKAIDAHLPPTLAKNFRSVLDLTGAGNHPDFIEGFYTLARLLGEGTSVKGNNPSPLGQTREGTQPVPTIAQAMYPHLRSAAKQG